MEAVRQLAEQRIKDVLRTRIGRQAVGVRADEKHMEEGPFPAAGQEFVKNLGDWGGALGEIEDDEHESVIREKGGIMELSGSPWEIKQINLIILNSESMEKQWVIRTWLRWS